MDAVQKLVELVVKVTDQGGDVLKKISSNFSGLDKSIATSVKGFKSVDASTASTKKSLDGVSDGAEKTSAKIGDLSKKAETTANAINTMDKSAGASKASVNNLGAAAGATGEKVSSLNTPLETAKNKLKGASDAADKGVNSFQRLQNAGGTLMSTFAQVATIIGSIAFPIVTAAKFERSMSEVAAISQASASDLKDLTQAARDMGERTEFSASQAAEALKLLAQAGFNTNQSIRALPGVLNLAMAGAIDLGKAADIATGILHGFGLSVDELGRVNDVLTVTANGTNSSIEELGYAMAYVAPVAAGLGANFEEVTAALGLLHNAGIKGSMAGTTLRGIMTRLTAPTKEVADMMKMLGARIGQTTINVTDAGGKWLGFLPIIKQLEKSGATTVDIMTMLGERAGPGLAALLSQGSKALENMIELNMEAKGRAAETAAVMANNVVGSYRNFQSVIEEIGITIGNILLPVLRKVIDFASLVGTSIRNLALDFPKTAQAVTFLTVALGGLYSAMLTVNAVAVVTTGKMLGIGKMFTWLATAIASPVTALVGLGALFAGLTFSDSINRWVRDFKVFDTTIGDIVVAIFAGVLAAGENIVKSVGSVVYKALSLPKIALGELLSYIADWGLKMVEVVGQVPGLGKMLGWDEETPAIKKVFEDLKTYGVEMAASAKESADISKASMESQLVSGEQILVQVLEETKIRKGLKQIREIEAKAEQDIEAARKVIMDQRKDSLDKLQNAAKIANDAWVAQNNSLQTMVETGHKSIETYGKNATTIIKEIWDSITNSTVVADYKAQLDALSIQTELFGVDNSKKMAGITKAVAAEQIKNVTEGSARIQALYDEELQKYVTLQTSQLNTSKMTAEEKLKAEENLKKQIQQITLDTTEKKRDAYVKATGYLKSELEKAQKAEQDSAKKIVEIQEQIKQAKMTSEQKVLELKRKNMTEDQVYASKVKEYNDLIIKAQGAVGTSYKDAITYAKEAQAVAVNLTKTNKDGTTNTLAAIRGVQESEGVMIQAMKNMESAERTAQQAQQANAAAASAAIVDVSTKYNATQDELSKGLLAKLNIDRATFDADIKAIQDQQKVVLQVAIDAENANKALGIWVNETAAQIQALVVPIKLKRDESVQGVLDDIEGVRTKLQEEISIKIAAGETVTAAEKQLADIAKLTFDLDTVTRTVKLATGEEVKSTGLTLAGMQAAIDNMAIPKKVDLSMGEGLPKVEASVQNLINSILGLPTQEKPKVVAVSGKCEVTGLDKLTDDLNALPNAEKPKAVVVVSDTVKATQDMSDFKQFMTTGIPDEKKVAIALDATQAKTDAEVIKTTIVDGIPAEKITTFKLDKAAETDTALEGIRRKLTEEIPNDKSVTVSIPGLEERKQEISAFVEVMNTIKENILVKTTIEGIDIAIKQVKELGDEIRALPPKTEIEIIKKVITKYSTEGSPTPEVKARTGMRLSGYGGGDRIPALLEAGEWIIRKEAVAKYGDGFLARLNAGMLPRFQVGGAVSGAIAKTLGAFMPGFSTGGKALSYKEYYLLVEEINKLAQSIDGTLNPGGESPNKGWYAPTQHQAPRLDMIETMLKVLGTDSTSLASSGWKKGVKTNIESVIAKYNEAGGETGYNAVKQKYYDSIRKQSNGKFSTDSEIEYQTLLGETFGGVKSAAENMKQLTESYVSYQKDAPEEYKKRLAEMFNPGESEITKAKNHGREEHMKMGSIGLEIQRFMTGGLVKAAKGLDLTGIFSKFAGGGNVASGQTIKHVMDFNFGNKTVGPFESSRDTIQEFLGAMALAKGRS